MAKSTTPGVASKSNSEMKRVERTDVMLILATGSKEKPKKEESKVYICYLCEKRTLCISTQSTNWTALAPLCSAASGSALAQTGTYILHA